MRTRPREIERFATSLSTEVSSMIDSLADLAFVATRDGEVIEVIWNLEQPDGWNPDGLVGMQLRDLVTGECVSKIDSMLTDDANGATPRKREINHRIPGIAEFPAEYAVTHSEKTVLFIGFELRAVSALQSQLAMTQRALEEDYSRLRQMETRHRVLFQSSSEAMLIVDADRRKVSEVNAAAGAILREDPDRMSGAKLDTLFHAGDRSAVSDAMDRAYQTGGPETFSARGRETSRRRRGRLTLFRSGDNTSFLCKLDQDEAREADVDGIDGALLAMLSRSPDAVALCDERGVLQWCNEAFLGMAEIALPSQARGEPLSRFLGARSSDFDDMLASVRAHGAARAQPTVLRGAFGTDIRVELSMTEVGGDVPMVGLVIRDISRIDQIPARRSPASAEQIDKLIKLVGAVPIKDLVRSTTEEIEKLCIEAALEKTGNNRASAAEMLGLSRQSLYVKLRRFGLL